MALGRMLDRIISEVFSKRRDSMILRGHLVSEDTTGNWEELVGILPLFQLLEVIQTEMERNILLNAHFLRKKVS